MLLSGMILEEEVRSGASADTGHHHGCTNPSDGETEEDNKSLVFIQAKRFVAAPREPCLRPDSHGVEADFHDARRVAREASGGEAGRGTSARWRLLHELLPMLCLLLEAHAVRGHAAHAEGD